MVLVPILNKMEAILRRHGFGSVVSAYLSGGPTPSEVDWDGPDVDVSFTIHDLYTAGFQEAARRFLIGYMKNSGIDSLWAQLFNRIRGEANFARVAVYLQLGGPVSDAELYGTLSRLPPPLRMKLMDQILPIVNKNFPTSIRLAYGALDGPSFWRVRRWTAGRAPVRALQPSERALRIGLSGLGAILPAQLIRYLTARM